MKRLRNVLLAIVGTVLFVVLSGVVVVLIYEEEVKKYAVNEINRHLKTEISVKYIRLSLLKKFPNASLEFSDVIARGSQKDTLLRASFVYLQFNMMDIFRKRYRIKKINLNNAFVRPKVYADGSDNFHVFNTASDTSDTDFSFELQQVSASGLGIEYMNHQSDYYFLCTGADASFDGKFSSNRYEISLKTDFFAEKFSVENISYLRKQPVKIKTLIAVNTKENSYVIKNGTLSIADLHFEISGHISGIENGMNYNLGMSGKKMELRSVLSLLPETYRQYTKAYSSEGMFYFDASLTGESGPHTNPSLDAEFGIKNATIHYKKPGIKLENVNLTGFYTTGKRNTIETNRLEVSSFSAQLGSGNLSGSFSMDNFKQPHIQVATESEIMLAEWQEFFRNDTVHFISGKVRVDASFDGTLKQATEYIAEDFRRSRSSGNIILQDVSFRLKDDPKPYNDINGKLLFDNNDIIISQLSGHVGDSDFTLKGFFRNIFSFFFVEEQKLVVDASLKSAQIHLDELIQSGATEGGQDSAYTLAFSRKANFYIQAEIGTLVFRRFEAKDVKGKIRLKDNILTTEMLSFGAMDGQVVMSGNIDASRSENFLITCDAKMESINIQKLFYQFENFGQDYITDKHLRGNASSSVQFAALISPNLDIFSDKIYTLAQVVIDKGELIGFEPMKALSSYIRLSDLEHIRFSTLHNEIEIRNRKVFIPQMRINSSAMNVIMQGWHSFDHEIDYRFKILLSELLAQKAKTAKKENEEFGGYEEESGGRKMSLFIAMTGSVDNPKFSYDRSGLKKHFREEIKTEKKELKSIMKEEFGWYKKDSSLTTAKTSEKARFTIQWEEQDSSSLKKEEKKPSLEKKEKKKKNWLDKITGPDHKQEYEEAP